jgi:4a-hydroxytetrahydrobiopterin dehydratase
MTALSTKHCVPCEGGVPKLNQQEVLEQLAQLNDWQTNDNFTIITKQFKFLNFDRTMGFINALAWIAHQENHHPDITFGYNYCNISYYTHAISGLSENDFICAAKIDQLAYGTFS